ncbi:MAG: outer membrane beta-barrel protein [Bacteroidaceae bacterium]|nr:outer membrane beta-barrel protein [Bacteroidaceae bacterium]
MKKVILAALVAVASLSANAQVWIGGDLGFDFTKADKNSKTVSSILVAPEVGYMFNEKWGIYADINFASISKQGPAADQTLNSFGFEVAGRYVFAKSGIASFFVDGGVGMDFYNKSRGSKFYVGFKPGVKFAASEKIELVAQIGNLGVAFGNEKAQDAGTANKSEFGLGVHNEALSLGIAYNF